MPRAGGHTLGVSWIFLLAALVGGVGGLLGVLFQKGVLALSAWSMGVDDAENVAQAGAGLAPWQRVLFPALGGLIAGLFLLAARNERSPFGIADIVGLVALRKGTIRIRQSILQILSSASSIASGGSIGREGANSQISATLSALLARMFRTDSKTRAQLLGCGVAAGMALSYNAPIAASIFVMEAVLGNFAMDVFAPIVVAAVMSTVVRSAWFEDDPIYPGEGVALDPELLFTTLVLGAVCGAGGVLFRFVLRKSKRGFAALPVPLFVRMTLGGLIVGTIGIWYPEVWGNGLLAIRTITDSTIDSATGEMVDPALSLVFALFVWKVVATCATAGSGALGGIFTPNLVVGASFGAFFGSVVELFLPGAGTGENRIAFALVGMAGLCAATNHTPITAVVLVFELTRDYALVLPLMLCCIIASVVARLISSDSYYSENLKARGESIPTGLEELAVHTNYVRDIMREDTVVVPATARFDEVLDKFTSERRDKIYVANEDGRLSGHIRLHDVKIYINDPTLGSVVIADDLARPVLPVGPEESLAKVMPQFDDPELGELPVASGGKLLGRITRRDLMACLSDEVLGQQVLRARFQSTGADRRHAVELPAGYEIGRVTLPPEVAGLSLDSVPALEGAAVLPVVVIRREDDGGEVRYLAHPDAILAANDQLVVLGPPAAIEQLAQRLG